MLEELKEQVCEGNLALPRNGLVAWTGGNLSARDRDTGYIVIKPSGRLYDNMTPDDMVVVDMDGKVVEGKLGPSSDTASHLEVYQGRDDVNSIVHTHSRYATAFAALGREIPCCLTAIAEEFGGPVPVSGKRTRRSIFRLSSVLPVRSAGPSSRTSVSGGVRSAGWQAKRPAGRPKPRPGRF